MRPRFFIPCALLLALCATSPLEARSWGDLIPDPYELRAQLIQTLALLDSPAAKITNSLDRTVLRPNGSAGVQLRVSREVNAVTRQTQLVLSFIPRVNNRYSLDNPGVVVIKRYFGSNNPSEITFSLLKNPDLVLRIVADGSRVLLNIDGWQGKYPLIRSQVFPVSAYRISTMGILDLLNMTEDRIGWSQLLDIPHDANFSSMVSMVAKIRASLPQLPSRYEDDGAMDADGRVVFISSGVPMVDSGVKPGFNCSGFAKWIADGLYTPYYERLVDELKGQEAQGFLSAEHPKPFLAIDDLKKKHIDVRPTTATLAYEDLRDPYFGLDWTRNIAAILYTLRGYKASGSILDFDVKSLPFVNVSPDKGVKVRDLELALYLLALKDPGYFYFASINGEFDGNKTLKPSLWQYFHVLVIFPYFEGGVYKVSVFESNHEVKLQELVQRAAYADDFVSLVKVKASEDFLPRLPK